MKPNTEQLLGLTQRLRSHYDSSLRSSLLRFAQMDYYISLALQGRTANVSLDDVQLNHFNSPSRADRSHGPSDAYADGEDKRGGFKGPFIPVDVVRRRQLYRETSLLESQPRPRPTCMGLSVRPLPQTRCWKKSASVNTRPQIPTCFSFRTNGYNTCFPKALQACRYLFLLPVNKSPVMDPSWYSWFGWDTIGSVGTLRWDITAW